MSVEIAAGLVVGFFLGATGAGAGSLLTPLLLLLGYTPATAVGTGLITLIVIKAAGAIAHHQLAQWPPRHVWIVIGGGVAGVMAASLFIRVVTLPDAFVQRFVGAIAIFVAVAPSLARKVEGGGGERRGAIAAAGAVVGAIVTTTSAGSGTLLVMALLRLTRWSVSQLAAMSNIYGVAMGAVALSVNSGIYELDPPLLAKVIGGAVPGAVAGAVFSRRIRRDAFDILFRLLTFTSGAALLI